MNEFIEGGKNKTASVSQFIFTFKTDGSVDANDGANIIAGTYLTLRDDGKTELKMNFPMNSRLSELTDDWYFVTIACNTIRFDDSGDIIQFVKH